MVNKTNDAIRFVSIVSKSEDTPTKNHTKFVYFFLRLLTKGKKSIV